MEFKKTLRKFFKAKTFAELPQESVNGQVLYAEDENSLYIDTETSRNRINPPADWEEADANSPSYVANKPVLGNVAEKNVATEIGDNQDIPTSAQVNEAIQNIWTELEDVIYWIKAEPKTYGVRWDYSNSSPVLTRIGDASEFSDPVPATTVSGSGSSPFDNVYPWSQMKEVNILSDGTILEKSDSGFSYSNDTMVWIPEFYYKVEKDEMAKTHSWSISGNALDGYKKHPGSGKYISKYHMSGSSSGVYSKTGVTPLVNVTRANCRTYCKAKGNNWRMLDISAWGALQMLYLVEFANWNSQEVLGKGWNTGSIGNVGGTDNAVYHTVKITGAHNQYRYVEDAYSNVVNWIDGFTASGRVAYISTDPTKYADAVTGYTNIGVTMQASGWIMEFACNDNCDWLFIPSITDSTQEADHSADYVTDRTWTADNGVRVLNVGGYFGGSASFGFFSFHAYDDASLASGDAGSRLLYDPML